MNTSLASKHCVPCEGGVEPLKRDEFAVYLEQLPEWQVKDQDSRLERTIQLTDFRAGLKVVAAVGELAEEEGHHPDIHLHDYKLLTISLTTHAINGLSINDFILAVKIDALVKS